MQKEEKGSFLFLLSQINDLFFLGLSLPAVSTTVEREKEREREREIERERERERGREI